MPNASKLNLRGMIVPVEIALFFGHHKTYKQHAVGEFIKLDVAETRIQY